jgi:hypothetical protein
MTIKQFVIRFISLSFLFLILIGVFNRIVDPFWYYRDSELTGFNAIKPAYGNYERQIKPILLMRDQPEAVILGSSYAEIGFDPNNSFFTDNGRLKPMNLALARASDDEVQCNFEFAVAHAHIKRALIGFHLTGMAKTDCKKFTKLGQINEVAFLLSMSSLRDSIKTIKNQKNNKSTHTQDGRYFFVRDNPGVDIRFGEDFVRYKKQTPRCVKSSNMPFNHVFVNTVDLSGLRSMIKIAKEHDIELVLFVYPRHAYSLELDNQCGAQDTYWRAMNQIANLIETEAKPNQVRAWQFYSYNELTTEPIGTTAKYWQDSRHFNFEMGNVMLEDMFGENPTGPKIGRLITTERIQADFRSFLQGRDVYLQNHPEFQSELQKLQDICSNSASKCNLGS